MKIIIAENNKQLMIKKTLYFNNYLIIFQFK